MYLNNKYELKCFKIFAKHMYLPIFPRVTLKEIRLYLFFFEQGEQAATMPKFDLKDMWFWHH